MCWFFTLRGYCFSLSSSCLASWPSSRTFWLSRAAGWCAPAARGGASNFWTGSEAGRPRRCLVYTPVTGHDSLRLCSLFVVFLLLCASSSWSCTFLYILRSSCSSSNLVQDSPHPYAPPPLSGSSSMAGRHLLTFRAQEGWVVLTLSLIHI